MYHPSKKIIKKYADVLVNYALNSGKGVKAGEVVFVQVPEYAKPLLIELRNTILKAKAHPIIQFIPDGMDRDFFQFANPEQIAFFPEKIMKGRIEQIDHTIFIIAETDKHELEGIDPKMIMDKSKAFKPYMKWRNEKENKGKYSWTLGLYGTPASAKEAKMTEKEYWQEIIKACYLNTKNPVETWKKIQSEVDRVKDKLTSLKIEKLNVKSKNTDLTVYLGKNRRWLGGSGKNIPSFEVFISPDCRYTEGHIFFYQPLYRYGNLIKDIYLEFKDGRVVKVKAKKGQNILRQMISVENADRVGEFSLTDSRLSKITKFMAETLFDENIGGKYGNTHIALGSAYKDSYTGDPSKVSKKQWKEFGYNESVVHTDIISTENRVVTAWLPSGKQIVIYKDGKFTV
ncbi:aminopeptidase [Candidatus Nomurabacteria bacterium]|nr:aminopeptidase [Candidatus Nomurabacteria bacterium]